MVVTDVRMRLMDQGEYMKAVASVTFDNVFVVHDIRVISSDGRMFISMPSRKDNNGGYRDIAHPINNAFRNELTNIILAKYSELAGATTTDAEANIEPLV